VVESSSKINVGQYLYRTSGKNITFDKNAKYHSVINEAASSMGKTDRKSVTAFFKVLMNVANKKGLA
jgi:hypothetical protein